MRGTLQAKACDGYPWGRAAPSRGSDDEAWVGAKSDHIERDPRDRQSTQRVRILIDTAILRRPHTGTARWTRGLIQALRGIPGHEILEDAGPRRIGSGWAFRPANIALQRWWYEVGVQRQATRSCADVLVMPAGLAARRGQTPQVVVIHDVNFLTQPGTYEPLFVRYATWAMRRAGHEAERIVTVSEFSKAEICRHLDVDPERVRVVYPGLEPPLPVRHPSPRDLPYALYVGVTEKSKNVGLLLDAWTGSNPAGLRLVVVGQPGRDHGDLVARAARMSGRVTVRGRVEQEELERWYRGASVFLFPSLTEGFGFPPLEAMQRGVPVIASDRGSLPEVLGEAALYHDARDPQAVRGLVVRLMEDASLREHQIEAGLSHAARYSWEAAGRRMAGILESVVMLRTP